MLARLYGARADEIAARLDRLVARHRRDGRPATDQWSERDAWLIAYPDQFGGPGVPLRELDRVVAALAPAINGVHVLPFHPSSSDGGFAVLDHALVDPAVGEWSDVARLGANHRLMADAVVNHVSARGTWFRGFLGGDAARQSFFRIIEPGTDLSAVVRPRPGSPAVRVDHVDGPVDVWATFGADQIDLDYREPEVLLAVFETVFRYVAHGASAVRLDAVAFLWKDPAGPSIHLPQTHTIVALLRSCLDEIDPSVILVTETNVAHDDNVAYLGSRAEPEAHGIYQFPLPPLVLHAAVTGDAGPLRRWAAGHDPRQGTVAFNFTASHDGVGLRPAKGWLDEDQILALTHWAESVGGIVNTAATPAGPEPYELAATWWALCGGDDDDHTRARHLASHSVAFALRGIPLVYIHALVGSGNDTAAAARRGVSRDLNRARFADTDRFLAELVATHTRPGSFAAELLQMLAWRRSHRGFHPDAPQRIGGDGGGVIVVERGAAEERAVVVTNFGPAASIDLPQGVWVPFGGGPPVRGEVALAPMSASWFREGVVSSP